jgi:hypothetical protein
MSGCKFKDEGKVHPVTAMKAQKKTRTVHLYSFFNLSAKLGWPINTTLLPLNHRERYPWVPIVQETGGPNTVWMGAENLANTGPRSTNGTGHSELLYRLS